MITLPKSDKTYQICSLQKIKTEQTPQNYLVSEIDIKGISVILYLLLGDTSKAFSHCCNIFLTKSIMSNQVSLAHLKFPLGTDTF